MATSVFRSLPVYSTIGGIIGGFCWTILPDLTVIKYGAPATKSKLSYFSEEKSLDEKTLQLTKEVEDKLLMNRTNIDHLSGIQYFWCKGLDVVPIGDATFRETSFIGLPVNFFYQNTEEVKLPTNYPASDQLRQAMVLSDSAKKFAVTSAYYQLDSVYHTGLLFFIPLISLGPYATVYYMQGFFRKKAFLRQLSLFSAVCIGFVAAFRYLTQFWKFLIVCNADRSAANLGEDYLNGGIEYFTKTLDRNQAIYKMGSDNGTIDQIGNQIYRFFDIPDPFFTTRLERLKKLSEEKNLKSK